MTSLWEAVTDGKRRVASETARCVGKAGVGTAGGNRRSCEDPEKRLGVTARPRRRDQETAPHGGVSSDAFISGYATCGWSDQDSLLEIKLLNGRSPGSILMIDLWKIAQVEIGLLGVSAGIGPLNAGIGVFFYEPQPPFGPEALGVEEVAGGSGAVGTRGAVRASGPAAGASRAVVSGGRPARRACRTVRSPQDFPPARTTTRAAYGNPVDQ